ncbi:uncharacterized protein LOC123410480 isoform X2 [Hordeum vulgare subsp. vulgare]|uniref:uncharacterized protein LOC123410480 isoform X2 n=1 Tax=Hordeum vulgare subsp. vulgare TaxID=112509 RepID=UPI000B487543|nr:uncharacterized protein LOC123410480 isoform X2 [Hordeum vulgare subsp. vulgare]
MPSLNSMGGQRAVGKSIQSTHQGLLNYRGRYCKRKLLNTFFCSVREKIMIVPRKKTQRDLRRLEKAEKATQLDKVAIFVVLVLTLRRKPDVLINLSPKIVGNSKYLGQEKRPIIAWVINQVVMGSTCVLLLALDAAPRPPIEDRKLAVAGAKAYPSPSAFPDELHLIVHRWNPCFYFCRSQVAYHAKLSLACSLVVCCLICLSLWKKYRSVYIVPCSSIIDELYSETNMMNCIWRLIFYCIR